MFPFTTDRAPLGARMRSELRHGLCPPAWALPSFSAVNMRPGSRSSATSSWKMLKSPAELSENYGREAADGEPRIARTTGINLRREAYRFGQFKFHSGGTGASRRPVKRLSNWPGRLLAELAERRQRPAAHARRGPGSAVRRLPIVVPADHVRRAIRRHICRLRWRL